MSANGKRAAVGGALAVAVAASWVTAYRLGAGSGQSVAAGVAARPAEAMTPRAAPPAAPPPLPPLPPAPAAPAKDEMPAAPAAVSAEPPVNRLLGALDSTGESGALGLRLRQAAEDLGLVDIAGAVDALAGLPAGPKREAALLAVIGRWAHLAPEDALAYAAAEAIPSLRGRMVDAVFGGWAGRDPLGALAWLDQNPDWEHAESAGRALFDAVGERPTGDALVFLEQIDHGQYSALAQRTLSRLLELDPLAVWQWGEGLPEGPLREVVIARSLTAWAEYDPAGTRDWMVANLDADRLAAQLPRLASVWARHAPAEARDWYLGLPAHQQAARVGAEVFGTWLREDAARARAWLDGARPSPALDPGFQQYAYHLQRRDPPRAMDLATNIRDERTRSETRSRVARDWAQRDPRAALAYLAASPIPPDERERLAAYAQSRLDQRTRRERR